MEVRETSERPAVSKTARGVQEVVVGKEATRRTETINDTVRGTQVKVERVESAGIQHAGEACLKPGRREHGIPAAPAGSRRRRV